MIKIKTKDVFRNWSFYLFATSFISMIFTFILIGMYDLKGLIDAPLYYTIAIIWGISYFVGGVLFLLYTGLKIYEKLRK